MGYDVRVTFRNRQAGERGPQITTDLWRQIVDDDPDLEMVGYAEAHLPDDGVLRLEDPNIAQMISHPQLQEHGAWITWDGGEIVVKNPDSILLTKLCEIALRLHARVEGDDGEIYELRDGAAEMVAPPF